MKERYKRYIKLYWAPALFVATSFIFTTFAWFAYSGISRVSTEIDVKAWYIELSKDGERVSNDIVITLNDVYPGMDPVHELVSIQNKGDSEAKLSYEIVSVRLMNNELTIDDNDTIVDSIAHDYPFHVNMELSKQYIKTNNDASTFEVSVTWPLDSLNDDLDSLWGTNSYNFLQSEKALKQADSNYNIRPAVQIVISVVAEQYINDTNDSDMRFNLGDTVLYDPTLNHKCNSVSATCLSTTVVDYNNKNSDTNVTLMPSLYNNLSESNYNNYNTTYDSYISSWTAPTRKMNAADLLNIISHDIVDSNIKASNISPQILGNMTGLTRINQKITQITSLNGSVDINNRKFTYLDHSGCFWLDTEYNNDKAFALNKIDNKTMLMGVDKTTSCKVIPLIIAPKNNL